MEKFFQLLVSGVALGSIYALVALGFVVVYKATGAFNFTQGGFVTLGTFLVYQFSVDWGLNFWLALFLGVCAMAFIGAFLERVVMRRTVGKPAFAVLLVTLGLLLVIEQVTRSVWTAPGLILPTPWQGGRTVVGGVTLRHVDFWTIGSATVLLVAFFLFFAFTRTGLGMRVAALDQEAAAAQGVSVGRVFSVSWAIAAAVAPVAGVLLTSRSGSALTVNIGFIALAAFPAMILGGLDSTSGAVLGGVLVGLAEIFTQGYLDDVSVLGSNFEVVMPYVLMVLVLLWRPHGLLGTPQVERA